MASMDRVMELNFRSTDEDTYFQESHDWTQPHVFQESRHTEKIEGSEVPPQTWRMKERMKTVSVALVLCLNVGVDPPGLIKLQPCARLESWVDPLSLSPQKALEQIGQNLQKQYERWQPRARYKQSLDPTVDEVKKLCVSLRRNAKEERVLFHYNGHGVPCPTTNGEIWVFNRTYTQYIPLSIYDLQTWMSYPSIYVYDCNNAGIIIKSFHQFAEQHEREYYTEMKQQQSSQTPRAASSATNETNSTHAESSSRDGTPPPPNYSSCIQLGACSDTQTLPMNPDLPADLFTACLTTPIRMALKWFVLQNQQHKGKGSGGGTGGFNKLLSDGINLDAIERVPGQLNDRRTMLGELNWIFTAITDTIAWNILPRSLFQKLFRQDLLVASLFRNFLLAERIMRSYDCTPVSSPKLPPTSHHPMWHAWDYALDQCLSQLKSREAPNSSSSTTTANSSSSSSNSSPTTAPTNSNSTGQQSSSAASDHHAQAQQQFTHTPSPFFEEQLTAFEVWLELGNEKRNPPEQLPIVLQVLLSQVHRVRALELLGKFLDLGWWAVNLALSVGIFPYVLKLLQSSAKELRPLLVFIWAKILAVDQSCQTDLVRDGSHKYFIQMVNDQTLPQEYRTMAVFVLSNIVRNYPQGQQAALQANSIATCLLSLEEDMLTSTAATQQQQLLNAPSSLYSNLHKWICICLGLTWQDFPAARWCGVRDSAHEKIAAVLSDNDPEVRAAAVFALGSFINGIDRTEHSNAIDHAVVLMILNKLGDGEGSCLVRQEIVVALHNFMLVFENQFVSVAEKVMGQEAQQHLHYHLTHPTTPSSSSSLSPLNLRRLPTNSNSSLSITNNARLRALANAHYAAGGGANMTITGAEAAYYYQQQQQQAHLHAGGSGSSGVDSMRRVASSSSLSNLMNVFIPPSTIGLPHHPTTPSSSTSILPTSPTSPQQSATTPTSQSKTPSGSSTSNTSSSATNSIYAKVYNYLAAYERDPDPGVSRLARTVLDHIRTKAIQKSHQLSISKSFIAKESSFESSGESIVGTGGVAIVTGTGRAGNSSSTGTTPTRTSTSSSTAGTPVPPSSITPIIGTKYINWCWSQFSKPSSMGANCSGLIKQITSRNIPDNSLLQPSSSSPPPLDPQDPTVYTRSWVYTRNARVRRECFKRSKNFPGKVEDQVICKNLHDMMRVGGVSCVKFHPYENLVVVGGPGVITDTISSGNSTGGSLETIVGSSSGSNSGGGVVDKSAFLIFEYDDSSHLTYYNFGNTNGNGSSSIHQSSNNSTQQSSHHHHHHQSGSSSASSSSSSSSFQIQPRILNKTEIEHTFQSYCYNNYSSPIINSLEWLNSHDSIVTASSSLLATGCNDGCVRVYKPCLENKACSLVTAWGLCGGGTSNQQQQQRISHVVMRYESEFRRLVVGYGKGGKGAGGGGVVGIWDVGGERLVRELGLGDGESCSSGGGSSGGSNSGGAKKGDNTGGGYAYDWVSCLDCNRCEPNVFVIGGEDGSVRLLDFRVPPSETITNTWRDFTGVPSGNTSSTTSPSSAILSVRLRHDRTIVAGSGNGRVRFYDLRSKAPTKTVDTTMDVTGIDIHPNLPYFAIGTSSSTVNIYGFNGPAAFQSNSIREGFGGFGRLGLANNSITSVGFHEFKPIVCFVDSYSHFSVYKAKK